MSLSPGVSLMKRSTNLLRNSAFVAVAVVLAACSDNQLSTTGPTPGAANRAASSAASAALEHARVCPGSPIGTARCHSWVRVDGVGNPLATTGPTGFNPADLQAAYRFTSTGSIATIAIVDAYDDGNAEADLAVYRSRFGLPACTTANGCFKKVDQSGGANYPRGDGGWAQEISLDLDMASAVCPTCHILLVEA